MYTFYKNKPCVTAAQFAEIFSPCLYRHGSQRNYFIKHGRGGNGRVVYIEVNESMRSDLKKKIIEVEGPLPRHDIPQVTIDEKAQDFYRLHRYARRGEEMSLPEEVQSQYTNEASLYNMIREQLETCIKARKGKKPNMTEFFKGAVNTVHLDEIKRAFPHDLPTNHRRLEQDYRAYLKDSYAALISGRWGNRNTEKVNDDAKVWVIATWANQVNRCTGEQHLLTLYNEKAKIKGWKIIKSPRTLMNFLDEPEIKKLWYGHRYGELKSKEKFTLYNSTMLPLLRDSLWYSDGTKLNYFYLNSNGEIKTTSVYEVMDVSSEFLLGFHISDSENFDAQYKAYRMALRTSGHRPYEIAYDNQGGHKKLETGDFLSKLAHINIRVKPYNGKSKTIESAFNRFQCEYLKRDWFFTGQNITAKKDESKANMEFITANKANLPSLEDIKKMYEQRREDWNNAQHPSSGLSRKETYYSTTNEKAPEISIMDRIELFWITRKDEITYSADGLVFTEAKVEYKYLKYNNPSEPDFDFHFDNIGRKFVVRFDPEDTSMIYVYTRDPEGRLRFVTGMTTKIETHRAKQEQEGWEAGYMRRINDANDKMRQDTWLQMDEILRQQGMHAEDYGLVSPAVKGVRQPVLVEKEVSARRRRAAGGQTADWNKQVSNAVIEDDYEDINPAELY